MSHSPTTSSQASNGAFTPPRLRPRVIAVGPGRLSEPPRRSWRAALLSEWPTAVLIASLIPWTGAGWVSWMIASVGVVLYVRILLWLASPRRTRKPPGLLVEPVSNFGTDPASVECREYTQRTGVLPSDGQLLQEIERTRPPNNDRAVVALLGIDCAPTIQDAVFEPHILSPSTRIGRRWLGVAVLVLIFLAFAPAAAFRTPPATVVRAVASGDLALLFFCVILVIVALLGGVVWLIGMALDPEYVRILPGEIQFVRFSVGARGRLDRSYPMTAGTTAILREEFGRITLTLLRGGNRDVLNISALWDQYTALERIWQSLLTTAPTPALTDKELLG